MAGSAWAWTSEVRGYAVLQLAAVRSSRTHKIAFVGNMVGSIAMQTSQLAAITVVLSRFATIGDWSLGEMLLLYGLRVGAHGIYSLVFGQLLWTDQLIRSGLYDRFLLRPLSPIIQVLTSRFNVGAIGDAVLGATVLVLGFTSAPITVNLGGVVYVLAIVISGSLLEGAVQLAMSALSFRIQSTLDAKVLVDTVLSDFGSYPVSIFGRLGIFVFSTMVPIAYIAYYPAAGLLGRLGSAGPFLMAASVLVGPVALGVAWQLFVRAGRAYASSGT